MSTGILKETRRWCVTGVAGFIGSHILERLLSQGQEVVGVDDLSAGRMSNLEEVRTLVTPEQWGRFRFVTCDVSQRAPVAEALKGCDYVLHHAALGSVPKSMEDPVATHASNVTGFLNILQAAREQGIRRVVYASSSAVYGDSAVLPAVEDTIGSPLSPYALSKSANEQYASNFFRCFGVDAIGLRYFNVFGARQDPSGAYAAVIPRWIEALLSGKVVNVFGDGSATRDFCPVANVVHANLLAAITSLPREAPRVFNVGLGSGMTLTDLFGRLRRHVARWNPEAANASMTYRDERPGDIAHSWADTSRIRRVLGFEPVVSADDGLRATVDWFAGVPRRP